MVVTPARVDEAAFVVTRGGDKTFIQRQHTQDTFGRTRVAQADPPVTALQLAKGFKSAILLSAAVSLAAVMGGIVVSLLLNLPTGAVIVMTNFVLFLVAFGVRACRRRGRN